MYYIRKICILRMMSSLYNPYLIEVIATLYSMTKGQYFCKFSGTAGVRLVGGRSHNEGRVEVYYRGAWGTVCDDSWSRTDASVVCRMLGYSGAVSAHGSAHFGRGTGSIWLDEVGCLGSESSLFDCNHRPWGYHDCSHFEDAGVVCQGEHVLVTIIM